MALDESDLVETVGLLRQVTADLVGSANLAQALDRLAAVAAQLFPGRTWCGISVLRDGEPSLAAHSAELPTILERDQYRRGEGPCLTAMGERDIVISSDLNTEHRWPEWCRLAVDHGARAVLCHPLDVDARVSGALNLYQVTAVPITRQAHLTALLVAEQAALVLGAVLDRCRYQEQVERLRQGPSGDRAALDRAVGIVMAQRGCGVEDAYAVLQKAAGAVGADLATVAAKLVSTVATRGRGSVARRR
jgi:GAF domain-containing protein